MASTIKLKNGSGAPLASDLVQGEPAFDLTNKRLYTEDSGGTVIEIGTSPSTIDINAGTVDGISSLSTANGTDVSFAGVSATKFFWDASAEGLTLSGTGGLTIDSNGVNGALAITNPSADLIQFTTGTSDDIAFYQSGAERVRFTASGNVGIGTSSPLSPLHVRSATDVNVRFDDSGSSSRTWFMNDAATGYIENQMLASQHALLTNGVNRLVIDSSGNVGIGTSSPSEKLHVQGTLRVDPTSGNYGEVRLIAPNGTDLKWLSSVTGLVTGAIAVDSTSGSNPSMIFRGDNNAERMRITSSGELLVNYTTSLSSVVGVRSTASATPCIATFNTAGAGSYQAKFYNNNTTALIGSITNNGNIGTLFNTTSDERLKENIVDTTHTVDINDIKVRQYDWKDTGEHQRYGFIAQELELVYPEAVHSPEDPEEMKAVDYSKLVPLLVKEIQDLKAEVAALKGA